MQYRPLRPVTGNIVRPSTAKPKSSIQKKTSSKGGKKKSSQVKNYQENQEIRSHGSQSRHSQSQRGEESRDGSERMESDQNVYRQGFDDYAREQAMVKNLIIKRLLMFSRCREELQWKDKWLKRELLQRE